MTGLGDQQRESIRRVLSTFSGVEGAVLSGPALEDLSRDRIESSELREHIDRCGIPL